MTKSRALSAGRVDVLEKAAMTRAAKITAPTLAIPAAGSWTIVKRWVGGASMTSTCPSASER